MKLIFTDIVEPVRRGEILKIYLLFLRYPLSLLGCSVVGSSFE